MGQGRSNQDLLPFTINTAIAPIALARPTADATHQMTIAQLTFAARPARLLSFNAKYRYADVDVQTRSSTAQAARSPTTRASRRSPARRSHSVKRSTFDADGAFQVVPSTSIKVGFSHLGTDYTSRIWESTAENVFRLSVDTTGNQYVMLRGVYENRQREGDGFEAGALEEVGELAGLRHYDIADRDRQRLTLIANVTPGGIFGVTASAGIGRDEYPDSTHGLLSFDSDQVLGGRQRRPDDRYSLTTSYGWERYRSLQRSRNANSAADQANPIRDWTTDFTGKVHFLEAALDIAEAIERTTVRLSVDWNRSNDTYLYGLVAGSRWPCPSSCACERPCRTHWRRRCVSPTPAAARGSGRLPAWRSGTRASAGVSRSCGRATGSSRRSPPSAPTSTAPCSTGPTHHRSGAPATTGCTTCPATSSRGRRPGPLDAFAVNLRGEPGVEDVVISRT